MRATILLLMLLFHLAVAAQKTPSQTTIPSVYGEAIQQDEKGQLFYGNGQDELLPVQAKGPTYTLSQLQGKLSGTATGISFDFGSTINGLLYYGFIPQGDSKHPLPVYFKRTSPIQDGKATIDIKNQLGGKYDMVHWADQGYGTLGYRVVNEQGHLLYDGKVSFSGKGPFTIAPTIIEGPFVNMVTHTSVTISFKTNQTIPVDVTVGTHRKTSASSINHEIAITGLQPDSTYTYSVIIDGHVQTFSFHTAPVPGSRRPFTFGYASDSRNGNGGGERNLYGANYYIVKKIAALAQYKEVAFMQFSGDLIDGYLTNKEEIHLQYANWKRAIEPFAHHFPVYKSMGNHEALTYNFGPKGNIQVDRFPFNEESAEQAFAENFVQPRNGPLSEDGAPYDPDPDNIDFPSYQENVFYYTYDNVAVVVLNSNYWYAPSLRYDPNSSGNLHGYIMDQQLKWLAKTLADMEINPNIDHIFITLHTPFFPNGGHVQDDMWYNGDNSYRPVVAGKKVKKGIIERRDDLLDLFINQSTKVVAILTGDEHNYAHTQIGPATPKYPENYPGKKYPLFRTIHQINNGAAGAPYYAQEETPWTAFVSGFTTQNALVLFHVNGKEIQVEVRNPDTLELIDTYRIK